MSGRRLPSFASRRLDTIPKTTVWHEFTPLAIECNAINLGQGFPSFAPPKFVIDNALAAVGAPEPLNNQYCRGLGRLELANALKDRYSKSLGRLVTVNDIIVTNGTTQGLNLVFQSLLDDGDEVVVIEPMFDVYAGDISMAGGVARPVSLIPSGTNGNDWTVDEATLRAAVTPKTKAILFNTPQNVPGKVWSRAELEVIARIAVEHDLLVVADEVYEYLTFDGHAHVSIASFPGMWERTVSLCSAGKTFTITGWKIGWIVGPQPIIAAIAQSHAYQCFSVATPLQIAVAKCMVDAESSGYIDDLRAMYVEKRQRLSRFLLEAGLPIVTPSGSFFILADITAIDPRHYMKSAEECGGVARDWQFCRWLTKEIGVCAIPVTAFCRPETCSLYDKFVRFAFCKADDAMNEAGARLKKLLQFRLPGVALPPPPPPAA